MHAVERRLDDADSRPGLVTASDLSWQSCAQARSHRLGRPSADTHTSAGCPTLVIGWPRLLWEQTFEQMRYRMSAVSGTAVKGAGAPRNTAAAQIKAQRRRYASAVLRSLSRTYAGRPAHEVQRVLASSMRPLGVRVNAGTLHQLAMEIAAGRPVELP